jgi:hypothetical protein
VNGKKPISHIERALEEYGVLPTCRPSSLLVAIAMRFWTL